MALAFRYEKRGSPAAGIHECPADMYKEIPLKKAVVGYVFNAAVVVGSAIFLPRIAEGLAEMTGLGRTFVGTIFIALSTSLPELTVTISSFRLGAVDMAVGNLFGSNLFNLAILALDDLFYVRGPLLGDVEPQHLISVFAIMAMNGLAAAGLIYRSESKRFLMAWESWAIAAVFVLNLFLLYALH
jgi:cation:H+ antiporter